MTRIDIDQIIHDIDLAIEPPVPLRDALEVLERLSTEIESRIEGIKEDMRAEGLDEDDAA